MKKIFTLVATALLSVPVLNAQTIENLAFSIDPYPWNYTADPGSKINLSFSSQWGEYGLIGSSNAVSPADLKGYKITYKGYPATAAEDGSYVQTSILGDQYNDLDPNATVIEQDFSNKVKALSSLTKFNLQGKVAGAKIDIQSFSLIKNDGTEIPVTSYAAGGWGRELGPSSAPIINFTGQYGGLKIVTADGQDCSFKHATQSDDVYTYNIALNSATTNVLMVEYDDASAGFVYNNFDAGVEGLTFEVSAKTAVTSEGVAKDVEKIYFKATAESGYPFTVDVKSVTRVKSTVSGIKDLNAKDALSEDANAPVYNLAGQKVGSDYKGVVIKNGKKMIQ